MYTYLHTLVIHIYILQKNFVLNLNFFNAIYKYDLITECHFKTDYKCIVCQL